MINNITLSSISINSVLYSEVCLLLICFRKKSGPENYLLHNVHGNTS